MSSDEDEDNYDSEILPLCDICKVNSRIYKCPCCGASTCSLGCCKEHKLKSGCTGKRPRTPFVPISKFEENTLRNDYHFLEDVLQSRTTAKKLEICKFQRDRKPNLNKNTSELLNTLTFTASSQNLLRQNLSDHSVSVKKLVKAAEERGTRVIIMPAGMTKRSSNTSRYHPKINKIFWRLHIVVVMAPDISPSRLIEMSCATAGNNHHPDFELPFGASGGVASIVLPQMDENRTISSIVAQLVDSKPENALRRHTLRNLRLNVSKLRCLLQRIPSVSRDPRFAQVEVVDSLRVCLKEKAVIEFPTLFLGPEDCLSSFPTSIADWNTPTSVTTLSSLGVTGAVDPSNRAQERSSLLQEEEPEGGYEDDNDNVVEEGKTGDDVIDEEFISTLKELERKDINSLREIISAAVEGNNSDSTVLFS